MIFASRVRRAGALLCSGSDLSIFGSCIKSHASCIKMQPLSIGKTPAVRSTPYPPDNAAGPGRAPQTGAGSGLGVAGQPARITIGVAGDEPVDSRDELDAVQCIARCA